MKSQNDLIFSIVAAVLGIGFSVAFFFMKREPVAPAAPSQVVTTALTLPTADPVMGNSLPGGSGSGGFGGMGGGFGGGMGGGKAPMGMGGMGGPPGMGGGKRGMMKGGM